MASRTPARKSGLIGTTRSLTEEFKVFISRGNIVELAIGLTVGVAFTEFVRSLVDNIFMPLISAFFSQDSFSNLYIALDGKDYASIESATEAGVALFKYGQFMTDLINFLVVALVVFIVIKTLRLFGKDIYDFDKAKEKDFKKPKKIKSIAKSKLDE